MLSTTLLADADRLVVGARLPELAVDEHEPGRVERLADDAHLADELLLSGHRLRLRLHDLRQGEDHEEGEGARDGQRDPDRHLVARPAGSKSMREPMTKQQRRRARAPGLCTNGLGGEEGCGEEDEQDPGRAHGQHL